MKKQKYSGENEMAQSIEIGEMLTNENENHRKSKKHQMKEIDK